MREEIEIICEDLKRFKFIKNEIRRVANRGGVEGKGLDNRGQKVHTSRYHQALETWCTAR